MKIGTQVVRKHEKNPDPVFGYVIEPWNDMPQGWIMVRWSNGLIHACVPGEIREVKDEDFKYNKKG